MYEGWNPSTGAPQRASETERVQGDWGEANARSHSHTKAARAVCRIIFISETAAGACR